MEKIEVLLAEDDMIFSAILKRKLQDFGYAVDHCPDGQAAANHFRARAASYRLCIFDVVMPKMDGLELTHFVRGKNERIPIILLGTHVFDEDIIKGFQAGGDEYFTKPLNFDLLKYKIEVLLKRSRPLDTDKIAPIQFAGHYFLDVGELTLTNEKKGHACHLTQRTADLLAFFVTNKNIVLTREAILYNIWGKDDFFMGRSMDVYITKIRQLFKGDARITLETYHGKGFKFIVK